MKNLIDYAVGSIAFFAVGYAIMMGISAFFLAGDAYDVGTILNWFFMLVFCATAATIVRVLSQNAQNSAFI